MPSAPADRGVAAALALALAAGCAPPVHAPPPVLFRIRVHDHSYGLAVGDRDAPDFLDRKREAYDARAEHLDWLQAIAGAHGALLTVLVNGETARDARLLWDDAERWAALRAAGHALGAHFHEEVREEGTEFWQRLDPATVTEDDIALAWSQHLEEVGALLGEPPRHVDAGTRRDTDALWALHEELLDTWEVAIESAGDWFTYTPWNHAAWEPFHRARGTRLSADPAVERLALSAYPQVGREAPQGEHVVVTTPAALARHLLLLLATWWTAAREGWPDRAWTFGVTTHLDDRSHDDDLVDFLGLVDDLAAAVPAPDGGPALVPATDEDVVAAEAACPGPFDFDYEAWLAGADEPYPWPELEPLALALLDTELVELVDAGQPEGVVVALLDHREVTRGEPDDTGAYAVEVGDVDGRRVLLLSTRDRPARVDLSAVAGMGTALEVLDGRTGASWTVDDGRVEVDAHPLVAAPAAR